MCILDGNAYDAKCLEMGVERDDDLEGCSLVLNNKQTPLLAPGASGTHSDGHKVIVQLTVRDFQHILCEIKYSACHKRELDLCLLQDLPILSRY